ncbi:RagB/SusD family nutrient uptake outer membrane protein [Hymenobacter caeli]|uniref:Tetratricopeptide (TPR) repeat protein n=1 Tax=Hymenobacter caeli TaxID=2735894 RepID=A0ABX2FPH2_9BACT|nr:RagB/SusD family nutrient uptake outer membrane protein [Hymenobacter caeli]NRT18369.1 tetratricopeptide (TPR) repeat protein [Hymenobacter caeli]
MKSSSLSLGRRAGVAALAVSLAVASGCKQFLDVAPQGQLSEDAIKADPAAAQKLVDGVYNALYLGGFGPDVSGFQYIILTDIASDDADKGSTPSDYTDALNIDNFTATSSNGNVNNSWNGFFQAVARANQALDKIPLSPAADVVKNRQIGEVRFLRAYFYFNLVRLFGPVPLLNGVPTAGDANNPALQTRASVADIYAFLIGDLQFAVDNLPAKATADVGRANKQSAEAMLAKVYLYQKNYQKAFDLTADVIANGGYALYPTYADIWRTVGNNNSESVFEVQTGVNAACNNSAVPIYTICQGPRAGGKYGWSDLGYGFNTPSLALANAYEAGDVRKAGTIITITNQGTVLWDGFRIPSQDSVEGSRYSYKAYHSRTKEPNCGNTDYLPKNVRIMRYAEVLLIHAEAALQIGNAGAAAADLTAVRTRAGLGPKAATLANIWQERRVELAMEHDRFFDLVRQESVTPGRIVPIFAAQGKTFVKGKHEIFPIPQPQIDLSGGVLTQNPGY